MNPFEKIGRGLFDTWESVAAGWHELWQRAGNALTRFHPSPPSDDETDEQIELRRNSAQWALLAAEVTETGDRVDVNLEVPGMEAKDFSVDVIGDQLVVRGEKHLERNERRGAYNLMERAYGRFERRIPLPSAVDDSRAEATYKRGVLRIRLPKVAADARRGKIKVGDD